MITLPPSGPELGNGRLRRKQQPEHIDVELPPELLLVNVLDRAEAVDTGVVHKDVDPSEGVRRRGKDPFHVGCRGDVSLDRHRLAFRAHNLRDDLVGALAAARVVHHDRRTLGRELSGDFGPYSFRAARHDSHFSSQPMRPGGPNGRAASHSTNGHFSSPRLHPEDVAIA